jgi:NADP-dependent 3-hydroxy acid dehydrogenase YdfG
MDEPIYSNLRKAIITGGSSGIGKSLVNRFCSENIKTAYADIVAPQEKIEGSLFFQINLAEPDQVRNFIDSINFKIGTPDILVCNAGKGIHQFLKDGNPDIWEEIFKINVFGTLRIIRGFLPSMVEKGKGDIVLISSVSSKHPYPCGAIYAATKAALDIIAETLRLETQPVIRVINVAPGVVDTNFFNNIIDGNQTPESIGWGALEPDDIADAIYYAISKPHNIAINNIVIRPIAQPM